MLRVADIRRAFVELKAAHPEGNHAGMLELRDACFVADEPAVFGKPNEDYINSELRWYLSQSLNVYDIQPLVPAIWKRVAADDGTILSNYGYLVFSEENGSQYDCVLAELRRDPDSRRGTMVYTRPSVHTDSVANGRQDFICTNAVTYSMRSGTLHASVSMRSNDAKFGYPNDLAWQQYVLGHLAIELDATPGDIVWHATSLHLYRRHWDLAQ